MENDPHHHPTSPSLQPVLGPAAVHQRVNGDTDRWNTNLGRNGAVINGDHVTANGLFVEHFQQYNTGWNGENGMTILYQNELPYDPPTQADWMNGNVEGWAGYKVGDR